MKKWSEHVVEEARKANSRDIEHTDFQYEYPSGLDLHPKSLLHGYLVRMILERTQSSRNLSEQSHGEWGKLDWALTAYVPASEEEAATKSKDPRRPTNVVIPRMLASLETYLTYMGGAFLNAPTHRYVGRGSERSRIRAALLERVVAQQSAWFKESLHLRTLWRDAFVYGIGAACPTWSKTKARRKTSKEITDVTRAVLEEMGEGLDKDEFLRFMEEAVLFEGNELRNIDPYRLILDPNVSAYDFQKGEFFGYIRRTNAMQLLRQEFDPEEDLFNCKYVRMLADAEGARSMFWTDRSGRSDRWDSSGSASYSGTQYMNTVDVIHFFIDIIPSELGIGEENYPVKWMFSLAGDSIIIQARPLDLNHGMFPAAICTPNNSGYDVLPVSHLATAYGMQEVIDFLIQSHVANVRKAINDMLVVDSSRIRMDDLMNPSPGKIIRLQQTAYGAGGIDQYIKQLAVTDVTRGHIAEAQAFIDLMNRTLGTDDIIMGDMSGLPERPTATGIGAAQSGSLSRLREIARVISVQTMQDIAWQNAYNTQQFLSQEVAVSILGRYESILKREYGNLGPTGEMLVAPGDIETSFEVETRTFNDGSGDNTAAISEVIKTALSVPGVAQNIFMELDLSGIFLAWARKSGFEDVEEFVREAPPQNMMMTSQVMPDEQVQQQAEAGNLIPVEQAYAV